MKLLPVTARIGKEFTLTNVNGIDIAKGVVAVPKEFIKEGEKDVDFIYVTCFGSTAKFLNKYGAQGARVYIKEWSVNQKKTEDNLYYDFVIKLVELIDYKDKKTTEITEDNK